MMPSTSPSSVHGSKEDQNCRNSARNGFHKNGVNGQNHTTYRSTAVESKSPSRLTSATAYQPDLTNSTSGRIDFSHLKNAGSEVKSRFLSKERQTSIEKGVVLSDQASKFSLSLKNAQEATSATTPLVEVGKKVPFKVLTHCKVVLSRSDATNLLRDDGSDILAFSTDRNKRPLLAGPEQLCYNEEPTSANTKVIDIGLIQRPKVLWDLKMVDRMLHAASNEHLDMRARVYMLEEPRDLEGLEHILNLVITPGDDAASRYQLTSSGTFADWRDDTDGRAGMRMQGIALHKKLDTNPTDPKQADKFNLYQKREAISYAVNRWCQEHAINQFGVCAGSWRLLEGYGGVVQTLPDAIRIKHTNREATGSVSLTTYQAIYNDTPANQRKKEGIAAPNEQASAYRVTNLWLLEHQVSILSCKLSNWLNQLCIGTNASTHESKTNQSESHLIDTNSTHWASAKLRAHDTRTQHSKKTFIPMEEVIKELKVKGTKDTSLPLADDMKAWHGPYATADHLRELNPWAFAEDGTVEGFYGTFNGHANGSDSKSWTVIGIQSHFEAYLDGMAATKEPFPEQRNFANAISKWVIGEAFTHQQRQYDEKSHPLAKPS